MEVLLIAFPAIWDIMLLRTKIMSVLNATLIAKCAQDLQKMSVNSAMMATFFTKIPAYFNVQVKD